jgi:hypothetical protein
MKKEVKNWLETAENYLKESKETFEWIRRSLKS